jgi:hypothetical protein
LIVGGSLPGRHEGGGCKIQKKLPIPIVKIVTRDVVEGSIGSENGGGRPAVVRGNIVYKGIHVLVPSRLQDDSSVDPTDPPKGHGERKKMT